MSMHIALFFILALVLWNQVDLEKHLNRIEKKLKDTE